MGVTSITSWTSNGTDFSAMSSGAVYSSQTAGTPALLLSIKSGTTAQNAVNFYRGNDTLVGRITVSSTATAYVTSSDYRLKENIVPLSDGIARLMQLKPSRFRFIIKPEEVVDGFIAHEVQDIVPESVFGEKDELDENSEPVYQGIDQAKLVPLLTAALQEAITKIEALETRVTQLGG
jgi:hypothetical protein